MKKGQSESRTSKRTTCSSPTDRRTTRCFNVLLFTRCHKLRIAEAPEQVLHVAGHEDVKQRRWFSHVLSNLNMSMRKKCGLIFAPRSTFCIVWNTSYWTYYYTDKKQPHLCHQRKQHVCYMLFTCKTIVRVGPLAGFFRFQLKHPSMRARFTIAVY